MTASRISVRPASIADSPSIARVCLLTANEGSTAEDLLRHPELPGLVLALPYLHLASGFAFVLVEKTPVKSLEVEKIVGFAVGTVHPLQFQREAEASWWPLLRLKYPKDLAGTPLDRYYVDSIYKDTLKTSVENTKSGPAHVHVHVIKKYRNYGCDRLLVDVALQHVRMHSYWGS